MFKRYLRGEMPLRESREYAGLTLEDAAKIAKLRPEKVQGVESGDVRDDLAARKLRRIFAPKRAKP